MQFLESGMQTFFIVHYNCALYIYKMLLGFIDFFVEEIFELFF